MRKIISTLSSSLLCLVLFSCAHNTNDNIQIVSNTATEQETIDEAIKIASEASEIINAEYNNDSPTLSTQKDYIAIIDMDSSTDKSNTTSNRDNDTSKKKNSISTYITNSGKKVETREFDGPIDPENLKLKDVERERIEVKTTLIKPVVNAMYEPQTITKKQAQYLADTIDDETVFRNHNYTNKNVRDLMENYTNLVKASSVCCVSTLASKLKRTGTDTENILNILKIDARNFYVQDTCLILSEEDINEVFGRTQLSSIIKDTRKSCICQNKKFMHKNIASFYKIYNEDPDFYKKSLLYRYKDKQGRITEHDMNETILNIAITLDECS